MEFKLNFNMDNAAFDFAEGEIVRILRQVEERLNVGRDSATIMDINGNVIGHWEIED